MSRRPDYHEKKRTANEQIDAAQKSANVRTDWGGGKIDANTPVEDDDGGNSLAPKMSAVNEEDELPCFLNSMMIFPFSGARKNKAKPQTFREKLSEHWNSLTTTSQMKTGKQTVTQELRERERARISQCLSTDSETSRPRIYSHVKTALGVPPMCHQVHNKRKEKWRSCANLRF